MIQLLVYFYDYVPKRWNNRILGFVGLCSLLLLFMTIRMRYESFSNNTSNAMRHFGDGNVLLFPQESFVKANHNHYPSYSSSFTPNFTIILALSSSNNIDEHVYPTIESILLHHRDHPVPVLVLTPFSPINPHIGYRFISHLFDKYSLYGYNISIQEVQSPIDSAIEVLDHQGGIIVHFQLDSFHNQNLHFHPLSRSLFLSLFDILRNQQALFYHDNVSLMMAFGQFHPVLTCVKGQLFNPSKNSTFITTDLLSSIMNECFTVTNTINAAAVTVNITSSYNDHDSKHHKSLFISTSQNYLTHAYSWMNYTFWIQSDRSPLNSQCSTFGPSAANHNPLLAEEETTGQCSLSLVLPGFMKSGSTYLFNLLMTHPLLLGPLVGAKRKEACCYLHHPPPIDSSNNKTKLGIRLVNNHENDEIKPSSYVPSFSSAYSHRKECYPYLQPQHDTLFTVDGCVDYIHTTHLPQQLLIDDNQNKLKVVFAVRDPILRLQSQHRFLYPTLKTQKKHEGNINTAMMEMLSLNITKELYQLATQALHHDNSKYTRILLSRKIWRLLTHKSNSGRNAATWFDLLRRSSYFPFIDHWLRFISKERMKIVFTARLQPRFVSRQDLYNTSNDYNNIFSAWNEEIEGSREGELEERKKMEQEYLLQEMNKLFDFLDLPQMASLPSQEAVDTHEADKTIVPPQHQLNPAVKSKLEHFFQPFNELLQELVTEINKK